MHEVQGAEKSLHDKLKKEQKMAKYRLIIVRVITKLVNSTNLAYFIGFNVPEALRSD